MMLPMGFDKANKKAKAEKMANRWIEEMQELGMSNNQMLRVIRLAKKKYKLLKK